MRGKGVSGSSPVFRVRPWEMAFPTPCLGLAGGGARMGERLWESVRSSMACSNISSHTEREVPARAFLEDCLGLGDLECLGDCLEDLGLEELLVVDF